MECETCAYYEYDEELDEYFCGAYMDQDDAGRLMERPNRACPYYRNGDEYAVVKHQM